MPNATHHVGIQTTRRKTANDELSTAKTRPQTPVLDNICHSCSQFNFNDALDADFEKDYDGVVIANVGKRYRRPFETDCSLCRILLASRQASLDLNPINDEDEDDEDVLRAFPFVTYTPVYERTQFPLGSPLPSQYGTVYINVVSSKFPQEWTDRKQLSIHGTRHGFALMVDDVRSKVFTAQKVAPCFDPIVAKQWMRCCKENHGRLCSSTDSGSIRNLSLIDCESLVVEQRGQTQDHYVALSYVWGTPTTWDLRNPDSKLGSKVPLPSALPPVISDAISVTKALGFRYLWVDKFCIDQMNKEVKHEQIQQMDSIYENAEITIIAAAGIDESCGLTGVGSRPRCEQPIARIGNLTILSTMRDPHDSIRASKWATRGWTFQEAVLSRRCLVFTDEQIYFECDAMNCQESLSVSNDGSLFRDTLRAGMFRINGRVRFSQTGIELWPSSSIDNFFQYLAAVEEYTARELSYPQDSLNAFAGIMQRFEKRQNPISQLWGIPILHGHSRAEMQQFFADALCWYHVHSCWDSSRPCRRPDFPSWSWAGWAGGVEYHLTGAHKPRRDFTNTMGQISLELRSGRVLELARLETEDVMNAGFGASFPRILRVEASIIPPAAFSCDDKGQWKLFELPAHLALSQGPETPSRFLEKLKTDSGLSCIFAGSVADFSLVGLILETRNGVSSRVGFFSAVGRGMIFNIWRDVCDERRVFRIQ